MVRCGLPQGVLRGRSRTDRHASTSQVVRATLDEPQAALREVPVTFQFPMALEYGQNLCVVGADPQIGRYIRHPSNIRHPSAASALRRVGNIAYAG